MKKLLFSLLFLAGCGFTPLYSQNNTFLKDDKVIVDPIPDQYGYQMKLILEKNLFSPSESPKNTYHLLVQSPTFSAGDKTITADEFASTMQVSGKAYYYLKDSKTGKIAYSNDVVVVSSYSVVKDPYATTVAKNHIQEELSKQLAEQIALDVMAKLSGEQQ